MIFLDTSNGILKVAEINGFLSSGRLYINDFFNNLNF